MNDRIINIAPESIEWSFHSKDPSITVKLGSSYSIHYVDPFPCYSHSLELVTKEVKYIESIVKLPNPVHYFLSPFECTSRTNGQASDYVDYETDTPTPYIMLWGKRVCLHPAMTRYLVAHEFGHCMDYALQRKMGELGKNFRKFYAENIRKIPFFDGYGAGKWHKSTSEIIANDIRVSLLRREIEFWQHEVPHPDEKPEIAAYWQSINESWFSKS